MYYLSAILARISALLGAGQVCFLIILSIICPSSKLHLTQYNTSDFNLLTKTDIRVHQLSFRHLSMKNSLILKNYHIKTQ
jgi:hypothetical protein